MLAAAAGTAVYNRAVQNGVLRVNVLYPCAHLSSLNLSPMTVAAPPSNHHTVTSRRIDHAAGNFVMAIMALDHVAVTYSGDAFLLQPAGCLQNQHLVPFHLTRWCTHFCAPTFAMLSGTSAYLVGLA